MEEADKMKARCTGNSLAHLQDEDMKRSYEKRVHLEEVNLNIGRVYPIFGVGFWDGVPWYLVYDEPEDEYPTPQLGGFFDLIDETIPPDWVFHIGRTNVGKVALLPKVWAKDPAFLEKLVDGDSEAIKVFMEMKSRYK
jgi:hypothetical protein